MATRRRDGWDTWVRVAAVAALTGCSGESVIAVDAQTAAADLGAAIDVVADVGALDRPTIDAGPPDAGAPDAGPPDAGPPDAGAPDVPPLDTPPLRCSARADCAGNAAGPACDVVTGRCVPCTPADDTCAAGSYCTPTNTCSPGCRDDGACATATDAGVDRGRCDPGTHQCVACASDAHCPPGNLCVGNVCGGG